MDVIDLVQKQNPDFGREALLEAFVNAHFDVTTGEILGEEYELHRVLNLLGRKDLNLGAIPNRIGKISFEEKQAIHIRFRELKRSAPKSKEKKNNKNQAGPYLQHLTQTELMALEAFDSSGDVVTNPAVATTLVQAHLEGWLPVAALPMDAKEILMQCMNQGDMQAAYLLGVKHYASAQKYGDWREQINSDEKRRFLIESHEERLSLLAAAKAHGNPAAIDWFEQKEMQEEMHESVRGDDDELYENWMTSDIERALKFGPDSTGKKKFRWGVELVEANRSHFLFSSKKKGDIAEYRSRQELACQWIVEAAKSNAEARYYLAKNSEKFNFLDRENIPKRVFLNELLGIRDAADIENERELVKSAAYPGDGIEPYYPAFIDLAEEAWSRLSRASSSTENFALTIDEVCRYLIEGAEKIANPDCNQAYRLASIWENVGVDGHLEKALHYYSISAKESPFAAFKFAMISLRSLSPGHDASAIRSYFESALKIPKRHGESLDQTAKKYSEIALKIGWGTRLDPSSWEETSMLYLEQLDEQRYLPKSQNALVLPRDVELLLQQNPAYEDYKKWLNDWRDALSLSYERRQQSVPESSVDAQLDEMQRRIYFLHGNSEPCSVLKLLAGVANEPDYLQLETALNGVDRSSILIKYLSSQLTLQEKDGQGKALGGLKEVVAMAEALQESPGGLGISFMANSLKWLQKKSLDGISYTQPNCRRVSLGSEMNGVASEFGSHFLKLVLQNLENGALPGKALATEVIYKDRYVNTPLKVAILAKTIEAFVGHLKAIKRWGNGDVKIFTGGLAKCEDEGTLNQSSSFHDSKERNLILHTLLIRSDIEITTPKTKAPHGRDLIVRFSDGSELRVGIDKGMSYWTAVKGGNCSINDYNPNGDIDHKVEFLAGYTMKIGQTEDECPLFVEWHDGKSLGS